MKKNIKSNHQILARNLYKIIMELSDETLLLKQISIYTNDNNDNDVNIALYR